MNFASNVEARVVLNATAAGTGDTLTSSAVDITGYDGCCFLVSFGAITTNAVTTIKAQQSSDDGSSDAYADLKGTAMTVADSDDNKVFLLDIYRPQEEYLKCLITRATANSVVNNIIALLYNGTLKPITQGSTVGGTETHASPDEGTA